MKKRLTYDETVSDVELRVCGCAGNAIGGLREVGALSVYSVVGVIAVTPRGVS